MSNQFLVRAAYSPTTKSDLDRILRLPYVESAYVYEKRGNAVVYYVELKPKNTMVETRELTGYIQNMFGARLLSSGQTQIKKPDGTVRSVVEARVSMLVPVESLVKPDSSYQWFQYRGKALLLKSKLGTTYTLQKGESFGVRKSSSGKQIRMIIQELGPSKVFTLDLETAQKLARTSIPI